MQLGQQFDQLQLFSTGPSQPSRSSAPVQESPSPDPNQLQMLMTPQEIKDYITTSGDLGHVQTSDELRVETMDELWNRKLEASKSPKDSGHGAGVYDALSQGKDIIVRPSSILGGRVISPTILHNLHGDRVLEDMHHRIAAQADIDAQRGTQTFLPVSHYLRPYASGIPGRVIRKYRNLERWKIEEIPWEDAN